MSQSVLKTYNSLEDDEVLDIWMNKSGDELRFLKRRSDFKLANNRLRLQSLKLSVPNIPTGRQALVLTLDQLKSQIGTREYNGILNQYDRLVYQLTGSQSSKESSETLASPKGQKAASLAKQLVAKLNEETQYIPWAMDQPPEDITGEAWQTKVKIPAGYKFLLIQNYQSTRPDDIWDPVVYPGEDAFIPHLSGVVTIQQIMDQLYQELHRPIDPQRVDIPEFYRFIGSYSRDSNRESWIHRFENEELNILSFYHDDIYFEGWEVDPEQRLITIKTSFLDPRDHHLYLRRGPRK